MLLSVQVNVIYIFLFYLIRYSGELREIGVQIDEVASFIWENVSKFQLYFIVKLSCVNLN